MMHGKHYKPRNLEIKCYECGSEDITRSKAEAWTYKWKCNRCNTYHFGVAADFMSGALNEDVYTSKEPYN